MNHAFDDQTCYLDDSDADAVDAMIFADQGKTMIVPQMAAPAEVLDLFGYCSKRAYLFFYCVYVNCLVVLLMEMRYYPVKLNDVVVVGQCVL